MFRKKKSKIPPDSPEPNMGDGIGADHAETESELNSREKRAAKKRQEEDKVLEEKLEYNRFPTIMGWYFDGLPTESFGLEEQWAIYFNDLQEEIEAQEEFENNETFTEKARRNFWPPNYNGSVFRTRGIYLDFKEVIRDPPRTPPEINFDRERIVIGVVEPPRDEDDMIGSDSTALSLENFSDVDEGEERTTTRKIRVQIIDKDRYYFDDLAGEFLIRTEGIDCYFDTTAKVWRKLPSYPKTPYNYYFDTIEGKYKLRDRTRSEEYFWDAGPNCWKKRVQAGHVPKNGVKEADFYFNEIDSTWIQILPGKDKELENVVNFPMGKRKVLKKSKRTNPEEFYYNGETCTVEPKDGDKLSNYEYDPWVGIWRLKLKLSLLKKPKGPSACDFKWDEKAGAWVTRREEEWRQIMASDFYFDDSKGRFFLRDEMKREEYHFDPVYCVCKKNGIKGPPANGLGPDDYYYKEATNSWELLNSAPKSDKIEDHPMVPRQKICKGARGTSLKASDEFYYDGIEGIYKPKEKNIARDYLFDCVDGAWWRNGESGAQPKTGLFSDEFYFNHNSGLWKEKSENIKLTTLAESLECTAYDWYFDDKEGKFLKRESESPNLYSYNQDFNVWIKNEGSVRAANGMDPKSFFFDENEGTWFKREGSHHESEIVEYRNGGGRATRFGPRGKNGKGTDDYYFATGDERYRLKEVGIDYEYKPELGCWIFVGSESALEECKHKPEDFYFDDYEGVYVPKKGGNKVDVVFDKNAHVWHKDRYRPEDYNWDGQTRRWLVNEREQHKMITSKPKIQGPISGRSKTSKPMFAPKVSKAEVEPDSAPLAKIKPKAQTSPRPKSNKFVVTPRPAHVRRVGSKDSEPELWGQSPKSGEIKEPEVEKQGGSGSMVTKSKKLHKKGSIEESELPSTTGKSAPTLKPKGKKYKSWSDPDYKNSDSRLKLDQPGQTNFEI